MPKVLERQNLRFDSAGARRLPVPAKTIVAKTYRDRTGRGTGKRIGTSINAGGHQRDRRRGATLRTAPW